ncbi:hypothetical protein Taro_012851 [Colocasia esculenta]|uniref:Uncharacterized protein n=1 Tax=Colocasia esculenta TaxID=4460 RepID=A0A843UE85_COLES|nr:hypothetical protein [Colocasia esculenta]
MRAGRHWTSFPEQPIFRIGTVGRHYHQSRSTLDLVPRTAYFQVWDSVSTPPPGQVDTLRKDSNLRWMIAMCHPRAMVYQPRIVCPYTQGVSLESFGYKKPPIGHPSHQETQRTLGASRKFPLAARRVHLPPLLSCCLLKINSHQFDCENWSVILEEAFEAPQGSRSSRSICWRRIQGRSPSSKVQSIAWDFKNPSFFPI